MDGEGVAIQSFIVLYTSWPHGGWGVALMHVLITVAEWLIGHQIPDYGVCPKPSVITRWVAQV